MIEGCVCVCLDVNALPACLLILPGPLPAEVADAGAGGQILMDKATLIQVKEHTEELGAVDEGESSEVTTVVNELKLCDPPFTSPLTIQSLAVSLFFPPFIYPQGA